MKNLVKKVVIKSQDDASKILPHLDPLTASILVNRGIKNAEEAAITLTPNYDEHVHDPFLMKDMDKAVERILKAIENKERIGIFTDYDADGIPAGVMVHDFLTKIGHDNFRVYIPHRHLEGFGLSSEAVDILHKDNVTFVITIDCGIADIEESKHAKKLGIDLIVTDHHLPHEELPDAFAIINPKQPGCEYPEKMLCGSGVMYKVIQAIMSKKDFGLAKGWEKWLLDMVGIATLSDMVPLTGENRVFAHYGLRVLRKSPRLGLQTLCESMKINQQYITEEDIGFSITPRINVASRMSDPRDAFDLLSTTDVSRAKTLVQELDVKNNERKGLVASIVKEIKHRIKEDPSYENNPVFVMGDSKWKPAVLGLAANTMMKELGKPAFLWGKEDGEVYKGSCRSSGPSVVEIMIACPEGTFVEAGGHAFSGGFAIADNSVFDIRETLNVGFEKLLKQAEEEGNGGSLDSSIASHKVDARLPLSSVHRNTWNIISKCAPFGEGYSKPLFIFENVTVEEIKLFGKTKEHVELILSDDTAKKVKAIQFFAHEDPNIKKLEPWAKVSIIGNLEESRFRNFPEYRIRIVEII
jgi:single-stranded-DNA-specific exonuclease